MSSDVREILGVSSKSSSLVRKPSQHTTEKLQRPDNVSRELWNLSASTTQVGTESRRKLISTAVRSYATRKAKLGVCHRVRRWHWELAACRHNPNLKVYQWIRQDTLHKAGELPTHEPDCDESLQLSKDDMEKYLATLNEQERSVWDDKSLQYLLDCGRDYKYNFPIILDRWNNTEFGSPSLVDIKEQYFKMKALHLQLHQGGNGLSGYDANNERKRKEQLERLYKRSQVEIDEENELLRTAKAIAERRNSQSAEAVKVITSLRSRATPFTASVLDEVLELERNEFRGSREKHLRKDNQPTFFASQQIATLNILGPSRKSVMDAALKSAGLDRLPTNYFSHELFKELRNLSSSVIDLYNLRTKAVENEEQMCMLLRCAEGNNVVTRPMKKGSTGILCKPSPASDTKSTDNGISHS